MKLTRHFADASTTEVGRSLVVFDCLLRRNQCLVFYYYYFVVHSDILDKPFTDSDFRISAFEIMDQKNAPHTGNLACLRFKQLRLGSRICSSLLHSCLPYANWITEFVLGSKYGSSFVRTERGCIELPSRRRLLLMYI